MSADERKVRKLQERHAEQDQKDRDEGLRHLLSSYAGRRYFWLLLEQCGVFRNPFNGNALATAFAAGEQNVGQRLLAHLMETEAEAFSILQKENVNVRNLRAADADRLRAAFDAGTDDNAY
jgi:hypothetical protein